MRKIVLIAFLFISGITSAQNKKPLDHTVYDGWQSIGERMISNDGNYVVYTINPQEGDGELVIQSPVTKYVKKVARGYSAAITEDSRYVVFKIKPFFQDTRQARIKKKKADEITKDTLAIIELGQDSIVKIARVKSYKLPEKAPGIFAYQLEKPLPDTTKKKTDSVKLRVDSLVKIADSVIRKSIETAKGNVEKEAIIKAAQKAAKEMIKKAGDEDLFLQDAEGDDAAAGNEDEGMDLVIRKPGDTTLKIFKKVTEYYFDKKGTKLLIETAKNSKDSTAKTFVLLYDVQTEKTDTVMKGFNDAKNFVFDEEGNQLAFVAERDSSSKALQKFYRLWYYTNGKDSATILADRNTNGIPVSATVSKDASLLFSKDGKKLFFATVPIRQPKDTTLVDFETAKLDIWNYKDDYLQTQQLKGLDAELKRSYTAVVTIGSPKMVQLRAEDAENITIVNEGRAEWVLAESDKGSRKQLQWIGRTRSSAYIINTNDGSRKLVAKDLSANYAPSSGGKFVYWYDNEKKNYYTYEVATGITRNITAKIKQPLYDVENDVPDDPQAYGIMSWHEGDSALYIYDQFDIWKTDPYAVKAPENVLNGIGRLTKKTYRYINTDKERRFIQYNQSLFLRSFADTTKFSGYAVFQLSTHSFVHEFSGAFYSPIAYRAKAAEAYIYIKESYNMSPDLYYTTNWMKEDRLSSINPQQQQYNWLNVRLFKWKAYNGKQTQGLLYTPEDFDAKKKYPMICYFYERYSDNLYNYIPPAPTASRINISFFVSRGYVVLVPDIYYGTGHPGRDAYDCIVSGARAVIQQGFVDSNRLGIQGQSWGGYQTAFVITQTPLFKAAWAGAPVANMTSAYGGIRWESGMNRQFQYEKQQSRIGASLWDKPQLYIENSPLFHIPKVKTPLVIMHNDADGAVPWYQGIELFTAMKRLGKPVWMLNYNGEQHNLMERRNRKDIQIREQQFFDWLLKGEKPPKWITEGVPATSKGIEWGLGY